MLMLNALQDLQTDLLDSINSPADLRRLPPESLERLAAEIRHKIIRTVAATGGHLAPSLGVVELTIALHYVFDTPKDRLSIWDVGHQSYAHKLLTGRRDKFHTLRQYKGISGFPKRSASTSTARPWNSTMPPRRTPTGTRWCIFATPGSCTWATCSGTACTRCGRQQRRIDGSGMIASVAAVLSRIDDTTKVIPGHGPLAGKAQLQAYHDMRKTVYERIAALRAKGNSVDEIVAAAPTADFDAQWGHGLFNGEQWVRIVSSAP